MVGWGGWWEGGEKAEGMDDGQGLEDNLAGGMFWVLSPQDREESLGGDVGRQTGSPTAGVCVCVGGTRRNWEKLGGWGELEHRCHRKSTWYRGGGWRVLGMLRSSLPHL